MALSKTLDKANSFDYFHEYGGFGIISMKKSYNGYHIQTISFSEPEQVRKQMTLTVLMKIKD